MDAEVEALELSRLQSLVAALEQLLEVQERVVVEQSQQLEQAMAQLNQYADALKRSNAQLEEFAYVASHDLQEPLRKIQAFGERLRDRSGDRLDAQAQDYLARMQNAATRMQQLINGLLTYSRIGTKPEAFSELDLSKVVKDVVADLEIRVAESDARVAVDPLPKIQAAPLQMRQLFQNVLGNALKFRKEGVPPEIRVTCEAMDAECGGGEERNGVRYELRISDNGIGFDSRYSDRIFGVFQRLHGRGEYEGTGIGLAVCRKIVERHRGTIRAESVPDVGTTFIIMLPATQVVEERA